MNNSICGKTAFILLFLLAAGLILIFNLHPPMRDFEVNYTAGKRMRLGETIYRFEDEHYMFKYLPSAALLYIPLALLPLNTAKSIWFILSLAALAGVVFFSRKLLPSGGKTWVWWLPALILAKFYFREIELGQINAMVTSVLLCTLLLLKQDSCHTGRHPAAGCSWGLAVSMKPYSFIFLPYWMIKKYAPVLAAGIAFILAAGFLPSYYYGFKGNLAVLKEWAATLSHSTPLFFSSQDNVSLIAFFTKSLGTPSRAFFPALTAILLLGVLILYVILKGRTLHRPVALEGAMILTCIPLVSPLGWDYTFISSTLGVMTILYFFHHYPRPARILCGLNFIVIGLSLYDLMGPLWYSRIMHWSVLTINFLILVGYLAYLRFKEIY
jgi:hypothetical protein